MYYRHTGFEHYGYSFARLNETQAAFGAPRAYVYRTELNYIPFPVMHLVQIVSKFRFSPFPHENRLREVSFHLGARWLQRLYLRLRPDWARWQSVQHGFRIPCSAATMRIIQKAELDKLVFDRENQP